LNKKEGFGERIRKHEPNVVSVSTRFAARAM